jgi:hypothetical protein
VDAIRAHQGRDKGLGPALGPTAGAAAEKAFREAGFRTRLAWSPWLLGRGDVDLVRQLVVGWETAAVEQRPDMSARIHAWAERRQQLAGTDSFALTVGHTDLLALPAD